MIWMWRLLMRLGGWRGIMAQALLAWRLLRDRRVPLWPKLVFPLAIAYFISPINLPLAWIPIIGEVDEIGIALLAVGAFLKLCPQELVAEHARQLEAQFAAPGRQGHLGRYRHIVRPNFDRWTGNRSGADRQPPSGQDKAEGKAA
jgi:uncharacterized membrane protein YkvA (DUF1232 family)